MPWLQPETDYSGRYVRVADTGLKQTRPSKADRPQVDDWIVLLMKQVNAQLCQGPLAVLDDEQCVVCSAAPHLALPGDEADDALICRCKGCLLIWHNVCACRHGRPDFNDFICPVCAS
eukprot:668719-Pyramimonas_sp.AAC.1